MNRLIQHPGDAAQHTPESSPAGVDLPIFLEKSWSGDGDRPTKHHYADEIGDRSVEVTADGVLDRVLLGLSLHPPHYSLQPPSGGTSAEPGDASCSRITGASRSGAPRRTHPRSHLHGAVAYLL